MHHHHTEHWFVVSEIAKVSSRERTFLISENEPTYMPIGVIHAFENSEN
jgi:mannose-1-phosphate guanylyltransferase